MESEIEHRDEDERFRAHPCNNCSFLTWFTGSSDEVILIYFPICEVKHPYMLATALCGLMEVKPWKGKVVTRRMR